MRVHQLGARGPPPLDGRLNPLGAIAILVHAAGCPGIHDGVQGSEGLEAVLLGESECGLSVFARGHLFLPELMEARRKRQSDRLAEGMMQFLCQVERLAAVLGGLVREPKLPKIPGQIDQACHRRIVTAIETRQFMVFFFTVALEDGFELLARIGELAEPEERVAQCVLAFHVERTVAEFFGELEHLMSHTEAGLQLPAHLMKRPQSEQDWEDVGTSRDIATELTSAKVGLLDLGTGEALGGN